MMRCLWFVTALAYLGAAADKMFSFELWSQIMEIHNSAVNASGLVQHPHGLRYCLMSPVFVISDTCGLGPNLVFSIYVAMVVVATSVLVADTSTILRSRSECWRTRCISLLLFSLLSFVMHGRIAFALAGMALLVAAMVRKSRGTASNSFLATRVLASFLLCSVSSGTFVVSVTVFGLWWFGRHVASAGSLALTRRDWRFTFVVGLLLLGLMPILALYVGKNLQFFGGGTAAIWSMLDHGAGNIFDQLPVTTDCLIIGLILSLVIAIAALALAVPSLAIPVVALLCAIAGGAFGYSTLTIGIPPASVLLLVLAGEFSLDLFGRSGRALVPAMVPNAAGIEAVRVVAPDRAPVTVRKRRPAGQLTHGAAISLREW